MVLLKTLLVWRIIPKYMECHTFLYSLKYFLLKAIFNGLFGKDVPRSNKVMEWT